MDGSPEPRRSVLSDFHVASLWAGLTALVWYAFGAIPLHLAVASQLGLNAAQSSSWIFIVWFSGAVASVALSLYYRQPNPITWTVPGLIYLGTLSGHFTFPEMVGASLMAGVVILILGLIGAGERIIAWLPLPIILGMFAGSILGYISRMVRATVDDIAVAGPTVLGYLIGKMINRQSVPPLGLAVLFGAAAIFLQQEGTPPPVTWVPPAHTVPAMSFTLSAFVAISLPLVVFAMGMGNVQGLGYLISQGYPVPVNAVSVTVGLTCIVNPLLGGHPGTVARTGAAILASLAILGTFQDALVKAFSGTLRFSALAAFAVAITPFNFLGINSAFWAIAGGLLAALLTERVELLTYWRKEEQAGG